MSRTWHKGPPPHVGWWNVDLIGDDDSERWGWFDGTWWSVFCSPETPPLDAEKCASRLGSMGPDDVRWTDYYPKNARVPRIDPRKTKLIF